MQKTKKSYRELDNDVAIVFSLIAPHKDKYSGIYGIPRGGVPIAVMLSRGLGLPLLDEPTKDALVVDDLIDSGDTLEKYKDYDTAVVYKKPHSPEVTYFAKEVDSWIEFPYELTDSDENQLVVRLLEMVGENPNREGLKRTPERFIKFYKDFLNTPKFEFTAFDNEKYDEMIIQKDIPFFSICEHHLLPFFGKSAVAYIPNGKIVGLSKLTRCVETYARRLQNQERITTQVADRIQKELDPIGVGVVIEARHLCMEMRGVRTHDVYSTTSKLIGVFKDKSEVRSEFLKLLN